MTWLTRLSLRNRTLVGLAAVLVGIFGVISMTSLKQELIPSLEIPFATVITPLPGASPTVVEQQVTAPVEAAIAGVSGVLSTTSTSSGGVSAVNVEMDYGTDPATVQRDLQQAVAEVRGLPQDVTPTVVTGSTDNIPVVQLAVSSSIPAAELARTLQERVVPQLEEIPDVSRVTLSGVEERMVSIDLDPAELAERGISPVAVSEALRSEGVRVPAGTVDSGQRELSVEVGAPITSVDGLRELYLPAAQGGPVRLADVARISSEIEPATGYSRSDGRPSIGIGITKTAAGNTVAVSHAIQDLVPEIENLVNPDGVVTVVFDQAPFIEQSIQDLTTEGLLGLAFAVVVILLFLLSLRATLVTAVSIPLSLLVALISLYVSGYSLNILTLGALTIAVGRVVDDSIVVIENIKRHLGAGEPMREAIPGAVREVAGAITASTITTVAVFLPVALVGGQVGELFRPFAVTVAAALLASLVVSLTIVPVLASWFLRSPRQVTERDENSVLQRGYLPVLRTALARPLITCLVAALVLVGTFALVPLMQTNFLSDSGQPSFRITQELPAGAGLAATDAAARRVEQVLADTDGVQSYQSIVGSQGGSSPAALGGEGITSNTASFFVTTDLDIDQTALQDGIRDQLNALPDMGTVTVQSGGGPPGGELEVIVRAENELVLTRAAGEVEDAVRDVPGAVDVTNNLAAQQPTVDVAVDRLAAVVVGLSEQQIGQTVATALRGIPVGRITLDGVEQDVVLRTGSGPGDLDALRALPLRTGPMGTIVLEDVAEVREVPQAASITRIDGTRSASITATPSADDLGSVTADLQQRLDALVLPPGATAEIGGVSAEQDEAFGQLGLALALAVAIVYLVMVATFRSLVQPLLLLVSIPFAATGALGLLLITGTPLGVPALIGMLMLIGIVVTNAIVLIDLVNQYRARGASGYDAVVDGARRRLRPILMTAVATICALFPLSLGLSGGGLFISQPLAVVVIGGLISSTLLTLVLVPVLYSLVDRARARLTRRRTGGPELGGPERSGPEPSDHAAVRPQPEPQLVGASAVARQSTGVAPAFDAPVSEPPSAGWASTPPAPTPAQPASFEPASFEPASFEPGPGEPVSGAPAPVQPLPVAPVAVQPAPVEPPLVEPGGAQISGGPSVAGLVVTQEGVPRADAILTLVDAEGQQVSQSTSAGDGRYQLLAPARGNYLVICRAPLGDPQAAWISIGDEPTQHHITLTTTTEDSRG
ncbi:MAG: efflux RND transporter permease subunit [Pseudonocardiaceae bacterium]